MTNLAFFGALSLSIVDVYRKADTVRASYIDADRDDDLGRVPVDCELFCGFDV